MKRSAAPSPSDEELVAQYLKGEKNSFSILLQRYKNGIFLMVHQFFHNRERSEEVFQEVFMKVLEHLNSFDRSGSFRSWLYALCRNHCIDRLRYQNRRPEVVESEWRGGEGDPQPSPLERASAPGISADGYAYDRELAASLDQALQKLPPEQRETFLLKERGGLTFEEIAEQTHTPVNTVKSRMRYALEALRRALKGKTFVKEALR